MVFQWAITQSRCKISLHTMPLLYRLFSNKIILKESKINFINSIKSKTPPTCFLICAGICQFPGFETDNSIFVFLFITKKML